MPIITLWGSSLEKWLGTREGQVCLPCTLSKEQGRRSHRGMGARTAMFLWNMVSAFQAFWSLFPHVFSLGTHKGLGEQQRLCPTVLKTCVTVVFSWFVVELSLYKKLPRISGRLDSKSLRVACFLPNSPSNSQLTLDKPFYSSSFLRRLDFSAFSGSESTILLGTQGLGSTHGAGIL